MCYLSSSLPSLLVIGSQTAVIPSPLRMQASRPHPCLFRLLSVSSRCGLYLLSLTPFSHVDTVEDFFPGPVRETNERRLRNCVSDYSICFSQPSIPIPYLSSPGGIRTVSLTPHPKKQALTSSILQLSRHRGQLSDSEASHPPVREDGLQIRRLSTVLGLYCSCIGFGSVSASSGTRTTDRV